MRMAACTEETLIGLVPKCMALRKRCRAAHDRIWHSVAVDQSIITQLESLRPAIKREWGALLRAEPTLSPLGHPDTLTYLMDETIAQVIKTIHHQTLPPCWSQRIFPAAELQSA